MINLKKICVVAAIGIAGIAGSASAMPIALDDSLRCGANNAINNIQVGDVTGNAGGASECWGTYDGNDPGPSGSGFSIGTELFSFASKVDIEGAGSTSTDPKNVGLSISGPGSSGTWEFLNGKLGKNFLIVLKAASSPGFAAWLFTGADAQSVEGDWLVAWTNDKSKPRNISHISVYTGNDIDTCPNGGTPPFCDPAVDVPVPASLPLLAAGIGIVGILARRRKRFTA